MLLNARKVIHSVGPQAPAPWARPGEGLCRQDEAVSLTARGEQGPGGAGMEPDRDR